MSTFYAAGNVLAAFYMREEMILLIQQKLDLDWKIIQESLPQTRARTFVAPEAKSIGKPGTKAKQVPPPSLVHHWKRLDFFEVADSLDVFIQGFLQHNLDVSSQLGQFTSSQLAMSYHGSCPSCQGKERMTQEVLFCEARGSLNSGADILRPCVWCGRCHGQYLTEISTASDLLILLPSLSLPPGQAVDIPLSPIINQNLYQLTGILLRTPGHFFTFVLRNGLWYNLNNRVQQVSLAEMFRIIGTAPGVKNMEDYNIISVAIYEKNPK
jgi:hypothetical protein